MATPNDFKQKAKDVPEGTLPSPQDKDREDVRRQIVEKDASKQQRSASGFKFYRIAQPYYRNGQYYVAGSIVSVPAQEKPAEGWEEVDQKTATTADTRLTDTSEGRAHGRASDSSPV